MGKIVKKISVLLDYNRMSRKTFIILHVILLWIIVALYCLTHNWILNPNISMWILIYIAITSISSMISRIHDIWYSWWLLILIVLLPGFFIYLLIKKWNKWKNMYGKNPKKIIKKIEKWDSITM